MCLIVAFVKLHRAGTLIERGTDSGRLDIFNTYRMRGAAIHDSISSKLNALPFTYIQIRPCTSDDLTSFTVAPNLFLEGFSTQRPDLLCGCE